MPMSHSYSFVSETHSPIPLRTRASLHFIKQCKVVQRPLAIFRRGGSKSITEGRYWDSWISTSSGTGVIMHLYLSTSSSLGPYHHQIHFPVNQHCIFPQAWPVEIEILVNINIYGGKAYWWLVLHSKLGQRWRIRDEVATLLKNGSCLTRLSTESSDRWDSDVFCPQYVSYQLVPSFSLSKCTCCTSHLIYKFI